MMNMRLSKPIEGYICYVCNEGRGEFSVKSLYMISEGNLPPS